MHKHMNKGKKSIKNFLSILQNLHTNCHFKNLNLKVDHHTWGKWFIHIPKCCKENQLQSLKSEPLLLII